MSSNSSEYANGEISQNGGLDDRSSSGTQTPAADHHESHGVKMFGIAEIPLSGPNRVLMCQTKNELLDNKCFTNDIRTIRDIEWFLAKPNVLLDCVCTNMKMIIERMLANALSDEALHEAREGLYAANNAAFQLSNVIQNVQLTTEGQYLHDPSWLCTYTSIDQLKTRRVVITRLKHPTNFGPTLGAVQFVILVLVPTVEKSTKSAFEIARTFSTLFSDGSLRNALAHAWDKEHFCAVLQKRVEDIKASLNHFATSIPEPFEKDEKSQEEDDQGKKRRFKLSIGKGLIDDFNRRIKYYPSDFIDGFTGEKTWLKVPGATLTLFFSIILPCVAFGVVDKNNTDGLIGPKEALLGQAIGGLFFALFSGQPMVIIGTTAPLCLYTQIVYSISVSFEIAFYDLYAAVGLWNGFFLLLYVLFDLCKLMHYCTRSTQELFATFIFFAFSIDAFRQCINSFKLHYCFPQAIANLTSDTGGGDALDPLCSPDKSILFVLLMFGTVSLALFLRNFSLTPYLSGLLRETCSDYALPLAAITFSLVGSLVFASIQPDNFEISPHYRWSFATLSSMNAQAVPLSLLLGFALSVLFFIGQNVPTALVSIPANKFKKGDAYHLNLLVVGVLNIFLSLLGLPWMHGILPHSPMHARALADVVSLTDANNPGAGKSFEVIRVRETRVTGILIHILITLVVTLVPGIFSAIPVAVLAGMFLFFAVNTLQNNSFYERVLLLITEQTSYPPSHYLRNCPQRIVHYFTVAQVLQLGVICFFGFAPWEYVKLLFPLIIGLLIPIRWYLLPRFCDEKYLAIIENKHC